MNIDRVREIPFTNHLVRGTYEEPESSCRKAWGGLKHGRTIVRGEGFDESSCRKAWGGLKQDVTVKIDRTVVESSCRKAWGGLKLSRTPASRAPAPGVLMPKGMGWIETCPLRLPYPLLDESSCRKAWGGLKRIGRRVSPDKIDESSCRKAWGGLKLACYGLKSGVKNESSCRKAWGGLKHDA